MIHSVLGVAERFLRIGVRVFVTILLMISAVNVARAQGSAPAFEHPSRMYDGFLHGWFDMVSATQARQPHWITPIATVTPRLEQEFRFDIQWLPKSNGAVTENYGGVKGLEFIPQKNVEIILNVPAYIVHYELGVRDGFGDFQALVKYRLAASSEAGGNYIFTAFLGISAPTGQFANGAGSPILTPTVAYGKGFENFDVQGTFGVSLPAGNTNAIGTTYSWNDAFQYRVLRKFWPEIEINYSRFQKGRNDGKTQVFLTPGLVLGKFKLWHRAGLTFGGGFQIAATHFSTSNHNAILSVRFPF